MADNPENGTPPQPEVPAPGGAVEHLNIKVTDNNNEVFFKIKRSTKLEKLMTAFCERQGKTVNSVRFLFEGQRVQPSDTPDTVCFISTSLLLVSSPTPLSLLVLPNAKFVLVVNISCAHLSPNSSKCKTAIP